MAEEAEIQFICKRIYEEGSYHKSEHVPDHPSLLACNKKSGSILVGLDEKVYVYKNIDELKSTKHSTINFMSRCVNVSWSPCSKIACVCCVDGSVYFYNASELWTELDSWNGSNKFTRKIQIPNIRTISWRENEDLPGCFLLSSDFKLYYVSMNEFGIKCFKNEYRCVACSDSCVALGKDNKLCIHSLEGTDPFKDIAEVDFEFTEIKVEYLKTDMQDDLMKKLAYEKDPVLKQEIQNDIDNFPYTTIVDTIEFIDNRHWFLGIHTLKNGVSNKDATFVTCEHDNGSELKFSEKNRFEIDPLEGFESSNGPMFLTTRIDPKLFAATHTKRPDDHVTFFTQDMVVPESDDVDADAVPAWVQKYVDDSVNLPLCTVPDVDNFVVGMCACFTSTTTIDQNNGPLKIPVLIVLMSCGQTEVWCIGAPDDSLDPDGTFSTFENVVHDPEVPTVIANIASL